uniref:Ankyrin 2 n=1 Tax=Cyclopterus lumpus TaxID=8103 RepID=A0A8C2X0D6_CYCLU
MEALVQSCCVTLLWFQPGLLPNQQATVCGVKYVNGIPFLPCCQTVTEKHKLNVPETMTEVLDVSDEEGESCLSSREVQRDDTMTGDGGEYLRAEDLRELGDDSLPGQYLDGMNYLRFSLEGGRTDRYIPLCHMFHCF